MTTITITKSLADSYKRIECSGHAGFADSGEDIVCAAISVLTINLINSLERFTEDRFACNQNEDDGYISISFEQEPSRDADLLLKSFELGVNSIFREYGKRFLNIKFRRE